MITAIIGIVLIGAVVIGPLMSNVETPKYAVIESNNNIEIRQYQPMIIAEVRVNGQRKDATGDGFRLLADYIFGNNRLKQDIAMTAPVQQKSTQIAMTAPVKLQESDNAWQVSFVMPAQYNMETLPKPMNERITLKEIPAQQFLVITFSGTSSDENIKKHEKELIDYSKANNISLSSSAKYAFYNPPWTLPLMRRNEVMLQIDQ